MSQIVNLLKRDLTEVIKGKNVSISSKIISNTAYIFCKLEAVSMYKQSIGCFAECYKH